MHRLVLYLLVFAMPFALLAQDQLSARLYKLEKQLEQDSSNTNALKQLAFLYLHKADYRQAIAYGQRLFRTGYQKQDFHHALLYAHIILGQAYTMIGDSIGHKHLTQAKLTGETTRNDSALCSTYNGLGLYNSNINRDYYSAIHYFFQGLEAAKRCRHQELEGILLANISGIYFLKKDTAGLKYSLEAYELGHTQHLPYLIYIGSSTTAYMYFLKHQHEEALRYIKEAEFIMTQNDFYDQGNVYALYGLILSAQNHWKEAIQYFQKGLALKQHNQTSTKLLLLHSYAQTLASLRRPREAIELLKLALSLGEDNHNSIYSTDLIKLLSECYEACGAFDQALYWQRRLQTETEQMFNSDKERTLSNLRILYDMEHQDNEIKQHRLELLQREKKEQLLTSILLISILIALGSIYLYQRKNRLYLSIVRQKQEAIRREQQLQNTIRSMTEYAPSGQALLPTLDEAEKKYVNSPLTSEKKARLFQRLELCMVEQAIYRDNLLTKEKVAELLNTNRTYLSQVINEQTGQTFTQYINRYRINEAVNLLSDPHTHLPLKAISAQVGFCSMTTFYKIFQNTIGMSPKDYRTKALHLSTNPTNAE